MSLALDESDAVVDLSVGDCELCGWWSSDLILLVCGCCRARYGLDKEVVHE